ncbi:unnamed protein product [Symbiodinium natans]|uniref:Uncharacterized protein n=1 Tax=Symbiodinium natans TaxID=878477 RepID=A0A812Q5R6_9DINO|nr:unnamed protein product [Symbiodinium natans]
MGCQASTETSGTGATVNCFQKPPKADSETDEVEMLHSDTISSKPSTRSVVESEFHVGDVAPKPKKSHTRQKTEEALQLPPAGRDLLDDLLDQNVYKMEKFLQEVETSPESLVSIIEAKRARCFGEKVPFRGPIAKVAFRGPIAKGRKQRVNDLRDIYTML